METTPVQIISLSRKAFTAQKSKPDNYLFFVYDEKVGEDGQPTTKVSLYKGRHLICGNVDLSSINERIDEINERIDGIGTGGDNGSVVLDEGSAILYKAESDRDIGVRVRTDQGKYVLDCVYPDTRPIGIDYIVDGSNSRDYNIFTFYKIGANTLSKSLLYNKNVLTREINNSTDKCLFVLSLYEDMNGEGLYSDVDCICVIPPDLFGVISYSYSGLNMTGNIINSHRPKTNPKIIGEYVFDSIKDKYENNVVFAPIGEGVTAPYCYLDNSGGKTYTYNNGYVSSSDGIVVVKKKDPSSIEKNELSKNLFFHVVSIDGNYTTVEYKIGGQLITFSKHSYLYFVSPFFVIGMHNMGELYRHEVHILDNHYLNDNAAPECELRIKGSVRRISIVSGAPYDILRCPEYILGNFHV